MLSELPTGDKYEGIQTPTVELIGDLLHVSPLALKAVIDARQVGDVAFVTDAIAEPVAGKKLRCSLYLIPDMIPGDTLFKKGRSDTTWKLIKSRPRP